jgi:hypothetical protein
MPRWVIVRKLYGACTLALVEATHFDLQAQCNALTSRQPQNDGPGQLALVFPDNRSR